MTWSITSGKWESGAKEVMLKGTVEIGSGKKRVRDQVLLGVLI